MKMTGINYNLSILPLNNFNLDGTFVPRNKLININNRKPVYKLLTRNLDSESDVRKDTGIAFLESFFDSNQQLIKYPLHSNEYTNFMKTYQFLKQDIVVHKNISDLLLEQSNSEYPFIKALSCYLEYEDDKIILKIDTDLVNAFLINPIEIDNLLEQLMEVVELYEKLFNAPMQEGLLCSAFISKAMVELDNGCEPLAYTWLFSDDINSIFKEAETLSHLSNQIKLNKFRGAFSLTHHTLVTSLIRIADRLGKVLTDYEQRLKNNSLSMKKESFISFDFNGEYDFSISNDVVNPIADTFSSWFEEISILFSHFMQKYEYDRITYHFEYRPCEVKLLGHYVSKRPIKINDI